MRRQGKNIVCVCVCACISVCMGVRVWGRRLEASVYIAKKWLNICIYIVYARKCEFVQKKTCLCGRSSFLFENSLFTQVFNSCHCNLQETLKKNGFTRNCKKAKFQILQTFAMLQSPKVTWDWRHQSCFCFLTCSGCLFILIANGHQNDDLSR